MGQLVSITLSIDLLIRDGEVFRANLNEPGFDVVVEVEEDGVDLVDGREVDDAVRGDTLDDRLGGGARRTRDSVRATGWRRGRARARAGVALRAAFPQQPREALVEPALPQRTQEVAHRLLRRLALAHYHRAHRALLGLRLRLHEALLPHECGEVENEWQTITALPHDPS